MELDHQAGGALALVFHVEDGDPFAELRLLHPAQDAIAHVLAQEEEQRRLVVHPAAQLVSDAVQARRAGGGCQQQLMTHTAGVDFEAERLFVHQQRLLHAARNEVALKLGDHAG